MSKSKIDRRSLIAQIASGLCMPSAIVPALKAKASPDSILNLDLLLLLACEYEDQGLVGELIDQGANVNALVTHPLYGAITKSPLMTAAEYGNEKILTELLERGANPMLQCESGWSALHHAAFSGLDDSVFDVLVDADQRLLCLPDNYGWPPFFSSIMTHDNCTLQKLLDLGSDVHQQDCCGETALHIAVTFKSWKAVKILLARGADPFVRNGDGQSPTKYSFIYHHDDVASALYRSVNRERLLKELDDTDLDWFP